MPSALSDFFSTDMFMPHGHCFLWNPPLLYLQVISNAAIGVSYVAISAMLASLVYKIRELPFKIVYLAFGTFIISCGIGHFFDIYVVWHPSYWVDAILRAITAVASVGTALLLPSLLPQASALVSGVRAAHARGIQLETAVHDLSRMYERSRQLEDLKTQFFANVSHELRTPLTLILLPVEKLLAHESLPAAALNDLRGIERNAHMLLARVNDLLDVAKLEAGKLMPEYVDIDAVALVRDTLEHFAPLVHQHRLILEVRAPAALQVQADYAQIQRVLINLVSNAMKFTPPDGRIVCTLREEGSEHWQLILSDSGCGIPIEQRETVFDRFAQVAAPAPRPAGGTGLGLSIVKDFVSLHRGHIAVDQGPEGGARFVVTLPRHAPADCLVRHLLSTPSIDVTAYKPKLQPPTGAQPEPLRQPGSARVLVVEDNVDMNRFVSENLADIYEIFSAHDGAEGLKLAIQHEPDLIISDLMMPQMSGGELLAEVRKLPQLVATPVLLLTAKADEKERVHLLENGAQDYLPKPFNLLELRARAANLVALKQTRDILQSDLHNREHDVAKLALQVRDRSRDLEQAVDVARQAQKTAEHLSRCKTDFVSLVSHELRTPLTAIQLQLARLLRQRSHMTSTQNTVLEHMSISATRLGSLIESVLSHNRLESGKLGAENRAFHLEPLVTEVVQELTPMAQDHDLQLRLVCASETPQMLHSDPQLLRMIVTNLVGNAIKFTPPGGRIDVSAHRQAAEWVIAVKDSGPGISAADQEHVFEPFVHLEPMTNKHTPGIGLGLTLVRSMTEALGGRVELASTPGQGTTFRVYLHAN